MGGVVILCVCRRCNMSGWHRCCCDVNFRNRFWDPSYQPVQDDVPIVSQNTVSSVQDKVSATQLPISVVIPPTNSPTHIDLSPTGDWITYKSDSGDCIYKSESQIHIPPLPYGRS